MAALFIKGLIVHIAADWFLQSDWMATNKTDLRHLAAWIHSGIHTLGFLFVFSFPIAIALGFSHLIIDTRVPLDLIRTLVNQAPKRDGEYVFAMLQDQAAHFLFLSIAVLAS